MGCDIHLYVEIKTSRGWEEIPCPKNFMPKEWNDFGLEPTWFMGRNYKLFALLAGVRDNTVEPIKESRLTIPSDCSKSIYNRYKFNNDFHFPQDYFLSELLVHKKKIEKLDPIMFPKIFRELKKYGKPEDIRLVLWFDN